MNSMDSVDSGCTMGASESNHAASSSSELVVWEIEVPKVSGRKRAALEAEAPLRPRPLCPRRPWWGG